MFSCRENSHARRLLATVVLSLFIGTFSLACQPRTRDLLASNLPDRESKLLSVGNFLDGVIASRDLKRANIHSEIRLLAGKTWDYPHSRGVFLCAIDPCIVLYNAPTAGSFLIRSPPSAAVA